MAYDKKWFWAMCSVATLALVCFSAWSAWIVFFDNQMWLYAENSLIENIQATLLTISALVFLVAAVLEKKSSKLPMFLCIALCYAFLVRELDIEKILDHPTIVLIGSGKGRNLSLVVLFASLSIPFFLNPKHYLGAMVSFLRSRPAFLMIAGGICLLVGAFFEKYEGIPHHVYFEEMSEVLGYVLILLASFAACL